MVFRYRGRHIAVITTALFQKGYPAVSIEMFPAHIRIRCIKPVIIIQPVDIGDKRNGPAKRLKLVLRVFEKVNPLFCPDRTDSIIFLGLGQTVHNLVLQHVQLI